MNDRRSLTMDEAEVRAFLGSEHLACVAGQALDGLTARRATYLIDGAAIVLELLGDDPGFDLERQPWLCVSVDSYPSHDGIKGVVVHGPATRAGSGTLRVAIDRVVSFDFAKGSQT